jgi:hypothetical protein
LLHSPLLHFLIAGALLFALQRGWSSVMDRSADSVVDVNRSEILERIANYQKQMGRLASESEARSIENHVIENALWLEQAWALGLQRSDPIVRQRLLLNMRFLEGESGSSEDELVKRAIDLGMDRSDTVVQRRLIDRVQAMIRAGVRSRVPDEAVLRSHYENTASTWREPALLDLTHVYLSRDKRGASTQADATLLLRNLVENEIAPGDAVNLADPFLSGHRLSAATPNRIVATLGPDFAAGIENAATLRWVGPVESAFGTHLVWIHERIDSQISAFDDVRDRVLNDWVEQETRKALKAQIDRRRRIVEVRVIDDPAPSSTSVDRNSGV